VHGRRPVETVSRRCARLQQFASTIRSVETMYAVVKIKGQQYRVEPGHTLQVPLLEDEVGSDVTFDEVLLLSDGDDLKVGNPTVAGASVAAEVVRHGRSRKVIVFKYKRRKNYRRKKGHRQPFTEVNIKDITA
jgi:large subunit ribosomal protein L21